jgi:hypothetical protein
MGSPAAKTRQYEIAVFQEQDEAPHRQFLDHALRPQARFPDQAPFRQERDQANRKQALCLKISPPWQRFAADQ